MPSESISPFRLFLLKHNTYKVPLELDLFLSVTKRSFFFFFFSSSRKLNQDPGARRETGCSMDSKAARLLAFFSLFLKSPC